MNGQSIVFRSGLCDLSASLYLTDNPIGGVLFIAGGGSYTKELYKEWQEYLASSGFHSLAFDFPGIGSSNGLLTSSSLNSRLTDAANAMQWFVEQTGLSQDQIFLCGRSMGGPITLRLATQKKHHKVILLYPAAYAEVAYDKPFGPKFSEVIRQKNSWIDSPDFELAEKFTGKLMIIYGELDHVIPKEIQTRYLKIAHAKGIALTLQAAGHNQYFWENDSTSVLNRMKLFQLTRDFLL